MPTLRRSSRGSEVKSLQNRLLSLGYDPGPVDGIFGAKTEAAVKRFQRDHGLAVDGIVGPRTYAALNRSRFWYYNYTIKPGTTFYSLSRQTGVSLTLLMAANPGVNTQALYPGQVLKVPVARRLLVAGWIPYWNQQTALNTARAHADLFTTLSPFWYQATNTGDVLPFPNAEDQQLIEFARSHKIELVPLISNEYSGELAAAILRNPAVTQTHIANIVNLVERMNYDGIEIDYENLFAEDRDLFTAFIRDLANALHSKGKYLTIAIHAKDRDTGVIRGALAHDYGGLGAAADVVRIMAYDYHWFGGAPGSIAPADWVRSVVAYATARIPLHKIILGLPNYGYDWPSSGEGRSISYNQAMAIAASNNASIVRDPENGPHYTYTAADGTHQVWFTDAPYLSNLIDIALNAGLPGIAIWYIGEDDPLYETIRSKVKS